MTTESPPLADLRNALSEHGLHVLAVAPAQPGDVVAPCNGEDQAVRSLILVGNAGSSIWAAFSAAPEYRDGQPDPLDRWSRRIGDYVAATFGLRALYPFGGPPHHPFQRWAARVAGVHPSPLRLQIHPELGVWHAYRFALASTTAPGIAASVEVARASPCLTCVGQPCLQACPAHAFERGYDAGACMAHLRGDPAGPCVTRGCAARHACPLGVVYRYQPEHAQFHMRAFVAAGRTSA